MSSAPRVNGVRQLLTAMRVPTANRLAPLVGLAIGGISGGVYWSAAQLWPSSVAVMLSILAGALLTQEMRPTAAASRLYVMSQVFYVLIKYNVLMALSAAKLPFAAPPNAALCLIMICGYGTSRALLVWMSSRGALQAAPLSYPDLAVALILGFAPALLLGLPGLIGLAAAVLTIMVLIYASNAVSPLSPWLTEICFYLGAQASWSFV